jgi:DNA replication protein DnaC
MQAAENQLVDGEIQERISRILADLEARKKMFGAAPKIKKKVTQPEQCPFEYLSCDDCKCGVRIVNISEPVPVQCIYEVSDCWGEVMYRKLIRESRLVGIELKHTFEAAKIDCYNKELYQYLQNWDYTKGIGVYIGAQKDENNPQGNGTGKSYALHALVHRLCREGVRCLYARTVDFLKDLQATYNDDSKESEIKVLAKYANVPVLLWDDLGKESFRSDWGPERFYHIIDERVRNGRPIVISSNFGIEELEQRFGDGNHGPAIVSRLAGHCEYFLLGGPDRRLSKQ